MLAEDRCKKILDILDSMGSVTVQQLMDELDISESTIRRDLVAMDKKGYLTKVHGGAIANNTNIHTQDEKVINRLKQNRSEKEQIARYAASLIVDNDFVYIDAGTTTAVMIDYITAKNVVFVTNSLTNAKRISDRGFINNTVLKVLGMAPVSWYTKSNIWPFILILVFLWQTVGHTSIIYMASIAGIDKGIYEAAKIDGAGKIKQIFYITLPLLRPTITIMVLMAIGKIFFSDFGLFYQVPMNSGALYGVTQTIDTFVYRGLMELNDVGMSSAAGLFQSCVGFVLVITANALVRKMNPENALF